MNYASLYRGKRIERIQSVLATLLIALIIVPPIAALRNSVLSIKAVAVMEEEPVARAVHHHMIPPLCIPSITE